jgi:hypothetical protein
MTRDRCCQTLMAQILSGLDNFDPRDRVAVFAEMVPRIEAALLAQPRRSPSAEYSLQLGERK